MSDTEQAATLSGAESLRCRGMRDLLPDEMARFRRVEQAFLSQARAWGYEEIRTPTLEHLYLFTSSGTLSPQLLGRVYSFLDWDGWTGERVVLRPDATIPAARLYRERLKAGKAKLAYVANIFRFHQGDEPREVWQCGAELIGDTWPGGDLELIALAAGALQAAGISGLELSLSHTGILRALLERAAFSPAEQLELYDRVLDGELSVLLDVEARLPELGAALRLIAATAGGGAGYLENLAGAFVAQVPAMAGAIDDLRLMLQSASALQLPTSISLAGAHDFEYYTGSVFEIRAGGTVLAGGGRYDGLITDRTDTPLPACGFALNVEAAMALTAAQHSGFNELVEVRAGDGTPGSLARAAALAGELQRAGLRAAMAGASDTHWQLKERSGALLLRDCRTGAERVVAGVAEAAEVMRQSREQSA